MTVKDYKKLLSVHCDRGKHRYRMNHFGVTWCVICGRLSNADAPLIEESEKINIDCRVR